MLDWTLCSLYAWLTLLNWDNLSSFLGFPFLLYYHYKWGSCVIMNTHIHSLTFWNKVVSNLNSQYTNGPKKGLFASTSASAFANYLIIFLCICDFKNYFQWNSQVILAEQFIVNRTDHEVDKEIRRTKTIYSEVQEREIYVKLNQVEVSLNWKAAVIDPDSFSCSHCQT